MFDRSFDVRLRFKANLRRSHRRRSHTRQTSALKEPQAARLSVSALRGNGGLASELEASISSQLTTEQ